MNKLAVIVPFYKRPEITKLCFEWLEGQATKLNFDVFVSGDDKSIVPSSFKYVECENNPLARKLNTLLKETKDYDCVSVVGSDDFVSDSVWEMYQNIDVKGLVYYGLNDLHTYSVWDEKLGSEPSYCLSGNTIGVARLWTKPTLEKMNYELWSNERNSGLDSDSKRRMTAKGIKEIVVDYGGHFVLDVKHELNITDPAIINTCKKVEDKKKIVEQLGVIGEKILSLSTGSVRKIKRKKNTMEKIRVKFIKAASGIAEGAIKMLPKSTAIEVVRGGFAIYDVEEKPKQTRKPRAKK